MPLDKHKKKELTTAYRQSLRPMGIYQIRNLVNGKIFIDRTIDLEAARNRHQFVTAMARPPIPELLADWQTYGGKQFVFEVLDQVTPADEGVADEATKQRYKGELDALLDLWLEKLQPYGTKGYNTPKRTLPSS
jgi:hypothetical protein